MGQDVSRDEFDNLQLTGRPRLGIRRATPDDLHDVGNFARSLIADRLAPPDVVRRVIEHNPNNLLLVCRQHKVVGLWAMLMLNPKGLEALLSGEFDAQRPNTAHLTSTAESPSAIYVWIILCPGMAAEGIHHVSRFLAQPQYRHANLYSRPTTEPGVKINISRGFEPLRCSTTGLFKYHRAANTRIIDQQAA
jgi:hypothetical protein